MNVHWLGPFDDYVELGADDEVVVEHLGAELEHAGLPRMVGGRGDWQAGRFGIKYEVHRRCHTLAYSVPSLSGEGL